MDGPDLVSEVLGPAGDEDGEFGFAFGGVGEAEYPAGEAGFVADRPGFIVETH